MTGNEQITKRIRFGLVQTCAAGRLDRRRIAKQTVSSLAVVSLLSLLFALPAGAVAVNPPLGAAADFAVLES